jgi:hypothetical protein
MDHLAMSEINKKRRLAKQLFILAGPPNSGKTTLALAYREGPRLQIFGSLTSHVRWHVGYKVVNSGTQIVFRENINENVPAVSIKGFMEFPHAELVDPPDGMLVHVDLFTLARVDEAGRRSQSEEEIRRNFEAGLQSLLDAYESVAIATLRVEREELARRALKRIKARHSSLRIRSGMKRMRVSMGMIARTLMPDAWSDKVFGLFAGGNREKVYFVDDGSWLERIMKVWAETVAKVATESYSVKYINGDLQISREK